MSEMAGEFTLTNYGNENRNCTLTTLLFPANFQVSISSAFYVQIFCTKVF
jgi:hypothetical protein